MAEVSFGEWLSRQRKSSGLTQKQLALQISCSTSALKKIEAEERRPSAQIVGRLAEIFEIPPSEQIAFLHFARGDWASAPALPSRDAPWRTPRAVPQTNLPIPLTSFIGRGKELKEIIRLLKKNRLVTLTGPGGVGKTRLAIQSATKLRNQFRDGVWWVELAPLTDEHLVPQATAKSLGLRELPHQSLNEALSSFLRSKKLLLVLDNCEHLIAGCAQLSYDLLTHCASLTILATSRETLDITGEMTFQVPSLSLPGSEHLMDLLLEYESIRLFAERAYFKSGFTLSEQNASALLQICRRLDGIPLALELAAARTNSLTAEQIAERLNDRFHLLTQGSRVALPRHQTLQAAIDWSYDLLSEAEQTLFRRAAVFAGGWTLEAAQGVCSGDPIGASRILDSLTRLVDKSLVNMQEQEAETRYQMLETIREYGLERLAETGETHGMRSRHRDWFLEFVEQARLEWDKPSAPMWLAQLEREHGNLRAALEWSLQQGEAAIALRLANLLVYFWDTRNHWNEGRSWIERALAVAQFESDSLSPNAMALWAKSLVGQGRLAFIQGDLGAAKTYLEKSYALYKKLAQIHQLDEDEKDSYAQVLNYLGFTAMQESEYGQARERFEEALSLYRELEPTPGSGVGFTLVLLGGVALWRGEYEQAMRLGEEGQMIGRKSRHIQLTCAALDLAGRALYHQGDFKQGQQLLEESLALSRKLGNQQDLIDKLDRLGLIAYYEGDYQRAADLLEKALAMSQAPEYEVDRAVVQSTYAAVILAEEQPARARALLVESLPSLQQSGMKWFMIRALEILAAVDLAEFHPVRAVHLFGVASAARQILGAPLPPPERPAYERVVRLAREQLGDGEFTVAWEEGCRMTLNQGVSYALKTS